MKIEDLRLGNIVIRGNDYIKLSIMDFNQMFNNPDLCKPIQLTVLLKLKKILK